MRIISVEGERFGLVFVNTFYMVKIKCKKEMSITLLVNTSSNHFLIIYLFLLLKFEKSAGDGI
jgi:hypothetical protein